MTAKRIPQLDSIAGASTANDDSLVIFDTSADATKRILRSQLAEAIRPDLGYEAASGSSLVGYTPSGTGAVATNVQAKLREFVSVRDFGAVGDGVTDDRAAFQAAVDAVSAAGGGTVFVPEGTYRISARVNLKNGVVLMGEGYQASILKPTTTNASTNGHLVGAGFGVTKVGMQNLVFDGDAVNMPVVYPLTQCFMASDILIDSCVFKNSRGVGINLSTDIKRLKIINCYFEDIAFLNGSGGTGAKQAIAFSGTGNQYVEISKNLFVRVGLDCISLGSLSDFVVSENIAREGYTFIYSNLNTFCTRGQVINNVVSTVVNAPGALTDLGGVRTQPYGIDLPYVRDCVVSGNVVRDCAAGGILLWDASGRIVVTNNIAISNVRADLELEPGNAGISVMNYEGGPESAEVLIDGNICTDDQTVKTQAYGLVLSNSPFATVTTNNVFDGNKIANIAYKQRTSSGDRGVVIRTENPTYSGSLHPGYREGSVWYAPPFIDYSNSPVAQTTNTIYLIPLVLFGEVTVDALGSRIETAVASTQARFGIYANDINSLPGVKLAEASAAISGSTVIGVSSTLTTPITLKPGRYWLAALCDGAIRMHAVAPTNSGMSAIGSTVLADVTNGIHATALSAASSFASGLPATLTGTSWTFVTTASAPVIAYRAL
jgi:parallel beta-helix repeat protein